MITLLVSILCLVAAILMFASFVYAYARYGKPSYSLLIASLVSMIAGVVNMLIFVSKN